MPKKKEISEADAMASWMASMATGHSRKPGETDMDVIKRALQAQREALHPMNHKKQKSTAKIGGANQKAFPYVFDLMFDIKSPSQALRKLKTLEEEVKQKREDYKELHRMMRENGYKVDLPAELP